MCFSINSTTNPEQLFRTNVLKAFPAFRHKNFRLYFSGQLVSLIGTWIQTVALGWLVLELTNSAFYVGLIATLNTLPVFCFALFGGVLVDLVNKKRLILYCQIAAMILALSLGILTVSGVVNIPIIMLMSFLLGVVNAIDMPARQSFVFEMVGKEDLRSAVALTAGTYNGARIIGPALAGFLIALLGIGGAFLLNGLSFLAVIVALLLIHVIHVPKAQRPNTFHALKEGIVFAVTHPKIRVLLLLTGILSVFGWSYVIILPVVAKEVFHTNVTGLGYLHTAAGIGAVVGTVVLSSLSKKVAPRTFIITGGLLYMLTMMVFSYTNIFIVGLLFLFFAGLGLIMQFSTINATIQHNVPDHLRGRIMSMYTFMFLGLSPFGSFFIGSLAEHVGSQQALFICTLAIFVCSVALYWSNYKSLPLRFWKR